MAKYTYTTNLKRGEDASEIYLRVLWKLEDDSFASILSENTLHGIAWSMKQGLSDAEPGFTSKALDVSSSQVIKQARWVFSYHPLSFLGQGPINHLVLLIESAIFPETREESS